MRQLTQCTFSLLRIHLAINLYIHFLCFRETMLNGCRRTASYEAELPQSETPAKSHTRPSYSSASLLLLITVGSSFTLVCAGGGGGGGTL